MTKTFKYKDKYGIKWISTDGKSWFVNAQKEAFDCGIWSGITTEQLNDPKYLQSIAGASRIYWNKYV